MPAELLQSGPLCFPFLFFMSPTLDCSIHMSKHSILIGVTITLLSTAFRFYRLDCAPPGLFMDEAMEGNQALEAATTGHFQLFYSENNGREGLFVWLAAMPLKIFGNRSWVLRSVSA